MDVRDSLDYGERDNRNADSLLWNLMGALNKGEVHIEGKIFSNLLIN